MDKESIIERFNQMWIEDKQTGCWNWTGSLCGGNRSRKNPIKVEDQYPQFAYARRHGCSSKLGHRVAYLLFRGDIPEGWCVCHRCDNPHCVNPDHLFLGTYKDNHDDMKNKDRHLRGERNPEAELTEIQVRLIHALAKYTRASQKRIAACFDIQQMEVCRILKGERWEHIYKSSKRDDISDII